MLGASCHICGKIYGLSNVGAPLTAEVVDDVFKREKAMAV